MTKTKIVRITYKFVRKAIGLIRLFNSHSYQKCFHSYLKWIGININGHLGYIHPDVFLDEVDFSALTLNDQVVISRNVTLLVHDYSISRAIFALYNENKEKYIVKPIIINKNSFIGANVTILPGSIIGENCVIGAGSVVTGNIPANSVAAGNPCRTIYSIKKYYEKQLNTNQPFLFDNANRVKK